MTLNFPNAPTNGQVFQGYQYNTAKGVWARTNFSALEASTTNLGIVELATDAETLAGTDATRAVTPAALGAFLPGTTGVGLGKAFTTGRGSLDAAGQIFQNNGQAVLSVGQATGDNLIINGTFRINQRELNSGVTATGYVLDQWQKLYGQTPLQWSTGVRERILILGTASLFDTVIQRIETNKLRAGTYTLSWSGTATGRAYVTGTTAGGFFNSPYTFNFVPTGDMMVEFIGFNQTLGDVKLEFGTRASPFIDMPINQDLANCQRYFWRKSYVDGEHIAIGQHWSGNGAFFVIDFPVEMRAIPNMSHSSPNQFRSHQRGVALAQCVDVQIGLHVRTTRAVEGRVGTAGGGFTNAGATFIQSAGNSFIAASAEL
jgi:hypothetical protein